MITLLYKVTKHQSILASNTETDSIINPHSTYLRNNIKEVKSSLKSIANSRCVLKIKQMHINITQYFMICIEPLLADLHSLSGLMAKPKQTEMINKTKPDGRFIVYKLLIFGSGKGQDRIEHHPVANFKLLPNLFAHKTQPSHNAVHFWTSIKSICEGTLVWRSHALFTGSSIITDLEFVSHHYLSSGLFVLIRQDCFLLLISRLTQTNKLSFCFFH